MTARKLRHVSYSSTGISSRANVLVTARSIEQPCLVIEYTGCSILFPGVAQEVLAAVASPTKQFVRIRGNHHGMALSAGERPGREIAGETIRNWLREIGA